MISLCFPELSINRAANVVALPELRAAIEQWLRSNFHTDHGLYINGSEIYWFSSIATNLTQAYTACGPLLMAGVRSGSNEGYIVEIAACFKTKGLVSYVPIYAAKVWTPSAGADLCAAIVNATWHL